MPGHISVGSGTEISIRYLDRTVVEVTGFRGRIATDPSRPDGTMRRPTARFRGDCIRKAS